MTYTVIGTRPGLTRQAKTIADSCLPTSKGCVTIGAAIIGWYLRSAPDGVVLKGEDGRYYETDRQGLKLIDPEHPGEVVIAKLDPPAQWDAVEWEIEVLSSLEAFARLINGVGAEVGI